MATKPLSPARHAVSVLTVALIASLLATFSAAPAAAADPQVGFRAQPYPSGANQRGAVTGEKPESKLWYHAGRWWAAMVTRRGVHTIHALRDTSWVDTGVVIDTRVSTKEDVLSIGRRLYILSRSTSASSASKLRRYTYDGTTYRLDTGFPVDVPGAGAETNTLARDSNGTLWTTHTRGGRVLVARTLGSDTSWSSAARIPTTGAASLSSDDISSVISFADGRGRAIGIMWSNQNHDRQYFAIHRDGAAASAWTLETALSGPGEADDHINLKTADGRLYAVTKTSLSGSAPLIRLLVRSPSGSWSTYAVASGGSRNTRPLCMLVLDVAHQSIYVFMTTPDGDIVYKQTSMADPVFGRSHTVFMHDANGVDINNATSMKATATATTGLVVMASTDTHYWWNRLSL